MVLRWKATRAGVFIYHCAPGGSMIPLHVVSGMGGAVMVLPREGLRDAAGKLLHYDRAYYIGENDFYVPRGDDGKFQSFTEASEYFPKTLELMRKLVPTHVVFEGKVGALTGKNALQAKVGETVLIIHSQINRDSTGRISSVAMVIMFGKRVHSITHRQKTSKRGSFVGEVRERLSIRFVSRAFTPTSVTIL